MQLRASLLALLLLGPTCVASEGDGHEEPGIRLRSGVTRPEGDLHPDTRRVVVRAERRDAALAVLRAVGARVEAPLGPGAYLVSLPAGTALATRRALEGRGASLAPLDARLKLAPEVLAVRSDGSSPVILVVDLFPDADPAAVAEDLRRLEVPVEGQGRGPRFGRLTLLVPAHDALTLASRIAHRDDVAWVARRFPRRLHNGTSVWVGQSGLDANQATPLFDRGLNGEGQIAGLYDTGVDIDHCFFRDEGGLPAINGIGGTAVDMTRRKVIAVDFLWDQDDPNDPGDWDDNGHGTHVGGTIAGDDPDPGAGLHDGHDGMAPAAKLVFQDGGYEVDDCADTPALGCPVVDLHFIFEQAYAQGVRVHQNSWGDNENADIQSVYTDGSQDADEFVWANPDFLLVFSAGNNGPDADTINGPSTGKNVVSVGATRRSDEADSIPGFTSRGPTDDGRVKPDVMFPGVEIRSARTDGDIESDNCQVQPLSGTSMSGPGAAGMAVLARQYFMDGFYPTGAPEAGNAFTPSAALLKATLINSAQNMGAVGDPIPSADQGWGRVLLDATLHFDGDAGRLYVDDDRTGFVDESDEAVEYSVEVASADEPLRATLVWTDYPSTPMAVTHLVNDLDLVLSGPGGEILGNVIQDAESVGGGEPDRLNNVEQIMIAAPAVGSYKLEVRPHAIPMGPQGFALVLRGDLTAERVPPAGGGSSTGSGTSAGSTGTAGTSMSETGSGGATTVTGTTGTGAGSGTSAGTDSDTDGADEGGAGGCGCQTGPDGAGGAGWFLLLLLGGATVRDRRLRFATGHVGH